MSFSLTALQLVNRVRRRMRHDDVTAISQLRDLATLDAVNRAMRDVLMGNVWEDDKRHTQIQTKARVTDVTFSGSAGLSSVGVTRTAVWEDEDVHGDFILRLVPTGTSAYANTAIRALTTSPIFGTYTTIATTPFELVEATSSTAGEAFIAEYMLPDTIRSVLTVTFQDEDLSLEQVGATTEFAELYPRQHIEYGPPKSVSVGGLDVPTYVTGSTAPDPGLRMIVWPPPDDEYVLDIEYLYRHPDLATATDTLEGVSDVVVDSIVDLATADMQQNYERNTTEGRALRADGLEKLDRVKKAHGAQKAERAVIGNWDGSAGRAAWRESLIGGRTIG